MKTLLLFLALVSSALAGPPLKDAILNGTTTVPAGQTLTINGTLNGTGAPTGTVSSVALTVPPFLSIAGSPVTTSGTLAITLSGTALPVANGGTGITSFGTGIATFLGTPTSANLAAAVTDETGSGALVFGTSPNFTTGITIGSVAVPTISSASALTGKTYNGLTISTTTGTLTLTNGKTLAVSNTLTLAGTDGSTLNVGTGGSLGSNAYTSTTYAPLNAPALTGAATITLNSVGSAGLVIQNTHAASPIFILKDDVGATVLYVDTAGIDIGKHVSLDDYIQLFGDDNPTTSSVGQTAFKTNVWAGDRGAIQVYDGTSDTLVVATLASDTPTNGQVPTWNTGGSITWETPSGGGSIVTPHVYYVTTSGNDTTGDGSLSAPYLTPGKAYDVGIVAAHLFVIDLGVGSFTQTLTANFNYSLCNGYRGAGYATLMSVSPTVLHLLATGANGMNSNGTDGYLVTELAINNLCIDIETTGGSATSTDDNTYTGGNGGNVWLHGTGLFCINARGGGDSGGSSGSGGVNGGNGGTITLTGGLWINQDSGGELKNTTGTTWGGGAPGTDGTLSADGCILIPGGATIATGAKTCGRCSLVTPPDTDKGGNAIW